MLSNRTSSPGIFYPRPSLGDWLWWAIALTLAIIVGLAVARSWMYCLGFCFLCLLLLWPVEVGLGTYVLFLPFEPISVAGDQATGTSITWVLGIVAGITVLGTMLVRDRFRRPPNAVLWWSLFVFWATISTVWAMDPALALNRLPTVFSLFLLYLICACCRFENRELKVLAFLCIAGGCVAAIYASFTSSGVSGGLGGLRNSLSLGEAQADPNEFAESLLIPQSLALGGFLFLRKLHARTLMLMAFAAMSYAVLLTLSRGALVAMGVASIVYIRYMPHNLRRRLLLPASFFGIALLMMAGTIFPRVAEAAKTGGAGRLDIWIAGFQAIKEHGWIGAGLDNFPLAYSEVAGYATQFQGIARASHNIFLNTWVELGLPGLVLFVIAIGHEVRAARRILRGRLDQFSAPLLICHAACSSVLTAGLFLDIVWRKTFWLAWTLLLLAFTVRRDHSEAA